MNIKKINIYVKESSKALNKDNTILNLILRKSREKEMGSNKYEHEIHIPWEWRPGLHIFIIFFAKKQK